MPAVRVPLGTADTMVVAVYLIGIVALGLQTMRYRQKKRLEAAPSADASGAVVEQLEVEKPGVERPADGALGAESSEYFLAGRNLGWPVIGVALFATNISTVHVIGLAGSGFSVGLVQHWAEVVLVTNLASDSPDCVPSRFLWTRVSAVR